MRIIRPAVAVCSLLSLAFAAGCRESPTVPELNNVTTAAINNGLTKASVASLVNGIVAPELKSEVVKSNGEDVAGGAQARGARLLGATLSADGSVRIALLNNKGLQASYKELGIAEAGWSKQACRQIRHFR